MILSPGTNGDTWHVIHTKSRHEKKLYSECMRMGLRTYLPLYKSKSLYRRRIFESTKPLFPGYLFCCFNRENRKEIYKTGHVANILNVVDQNGLIRDLTEIEKAIALEVSLTPSRFMKRGSRVRIVDGPFEGIEGIISQRRGKYRVVLNVNLIEMAAAIEVNAFQVELLDNDNARGRGKSKN